MSEEIYQIRVKSSLSPKRSSWFDDMALPIPPQGRCSSVARLLIRLHCMHGVLLKIQDLGLPWLEVQCSSSAPDDGLVNSEGKSGSKQE